MGWVPDILHLIGFNAKRGTIKEVVGASIDVFVDRKGGHMSIC